MIDKETLKIISYIKRNSKALSVSSDDELMLPKFYKQGLSQSSVAFWVSIILCILGVLIIAFCIVFGSVTGTIDLTLIGSIAGVLINIVGGTIFVVNKQTQKTNVMYYEKLAKRDDIEKAIGLCNQLPTAKKRNEHLEQIIIRLYELN
jgi:hypothetical protein